ncbi:MAG TPA: hypothetical protein VGU63_10340 [Candidatus Acidoferrales bacterium]|nr:hypothetical protein [Candidatus Acidoferrales bacterium]
MKLRQAFLLRWAMCAAIGPVLAITCGCKRSSSTEANSAESSKTNRPQLMRFSPTGASICLQQMIKNSPGPLHLAFMEVSSDSKSINIEADVTPATIAYTKRESSAGQTSESTKKLDRAHLSETDLDFDIMGPVPWHGELVAGQDAARTQGTENVNGYDTLKYAIDTANEPAAQKATFDELLLVKNYKIKGTAWVTSGTGCLVKYFIDFEQDAKDGSVKRTHFEGNVAKK